MSDDVDTLIRSRMATIYRLMGDVSDALESMMVYNKKILDTIIDRINEIKDDESARPKKRVILIGRRGHMEIIEIAVGHKKEAKT